MKKYILFVGIFISMLVPLAALHAQEVATLTGLPAPHDAIVRQYTDDQSIFYFDDHTNHYFVLQKHVAPYVTIMAQFPSYLEVHDFEVYNDVVYFCGKFPNGGNPEGFIGQISVADLFFNNNLYNFGRINCCLSFGSSSSFTHMTSCDRMDVFEDGGFVHLAVVGEMEHSNYYGNSLRRTAGDFWFDGAVWNGAVLYQKEDLYKTSDITCTKNHVVVTAYDDDSNYSILLVFDKISGFPLYPTFNNSIRIKDYRYNDNILVERLSEDDVAVAHQFRNLSTGAMGTALHHIEHVNLLPMALGNMSIHYTHTGTTKYDLRYNINSDRLLLLHLVGSPLWAMGKTTVFDFPAYNLSLLTAQAWYYNDSVKLFSVDNRVQSPYFSLGGVYQSAGPLLTIKTPFSGNCYGSVPFFYEDVTPNVSFFTGPFDDAVVTGNPYLINYIYPNPSQIINNIICQ